MSFHTKFLNKELTKGLIPSQEEVPGEANGDSNADAHRKVEKKLRSLLGDIRELVIENSRREALPGTSTDWDVTVGLMPIGGDYITGMLIHGKVVKVVVPASLDKYEFLITDKLNAKKLETIESEMKTFYEEDPAVSHINGVPFPGCYAAYIPEWKKWVRCHFRRLPLGSTTCQQFPVKLYDYGINKVVRRADIRYLTKKFYLLPQQCYAAKLHSTSIGTLHEMQKHVLDQTMTFEIVGVVDQPDENRVFVLKVINKKRWEYLCLNEDKSMLS